MIEFDSACVALAMLKLLTLSLIKSMGRFDLEPVGVI